MFANHLVRCLARINLSVTISCYYYCFHSVICVANFLLFHLKPCTLLYSEKIDTSTMLFFFDGGSLLVNNILK